MRDNKFFIALALAAVGSFSLAGLYVAVKGTRPSAEPAPVQPKRVDKYRDGDDIRLLSADAAGIRAASTPGGECSLDYLGQDGVAPQILVQGRPTGISGWGAYPQESVERVLLEWKPADGAALPGGFVELNSGLERADVAAAKASEIHRNVGYGRSGALLDAPPGAYRLYLVLQTKAGLIQCDLKRNVTVQAAAGPQ